MPRKNNQSAPRCRESGNVMVYILVAIALLAALSYAVAQGGRSNTKMIGSEKERLLATEIVHYADTVEKAVMQLRLRGTAATALSFSHPDLPAGDYGTYTADTAVNKRFDEIFNPAGGAVIYRKPSPEVTTTGTENYMFLANNEVTGIGSTCGDQSCSDLLMALANVRENICITINNLIGISNPAGNPPAIATINKAAKFSGTFGYSATIGGALANKSEGCFYETNADQYVYYKVLLAR